MPSDEWIEQEARNYVCGGHEPQTQYERGAVKNISALLLATVKKALHVERLAEIEARGAHLAEHHPEGERAELSGARICEILVSHGYHPAISIMAAVRDIIAEARSAGTPSSGGRWNDVVKALSELHEVYFMERLTSDVEMLEGLENLMDAYVAWLD